MTTVAERREQENEAQRTKLWMWLLASVGLHVLIVLIWLLRLLINPPVPDQKPIEFTIVDPSDIAPTNADLRANANSLNAGEAKPEDPSAGRPAQSQAAPPAPQPAPPPAPPQTQPQPSQPEAEAQPEAEEAPPVEEVPPPAPENTEPDPQPLEEQPIAEAAPIPAPTPTPEPTPVPTPPPTPQTRQSSLEQLAATPTPPAPPTPPTRQSAASQLGGPIAANSAAGPGGTAYSGPINPSQTAPGAPSVAASAALDWGPYLARLQRAVERNWIPGASTSSRRTVVTFTIGRGGELSNVGIAQSSGNPQTDSAALAAIQRTTMEPLPAEYTGSSVAINFTFDLNVLGGGISTQ